ncbi:hypothetical protein BZA77DRAFT_391434 [Pyronema omphalodes]|nr:hypothetical protein BZA77DRAFT_391434 [Pyronema omphalodes]
MCCESFVYRDIGKDGKFFDCLDVSGKFERIGRVRNENDLTFPLSLSNSTTREDILCDWVTPTNSTPTPSKGSGTQATFITQTLWSTSTALPAPTTTAQTVDQPILSPKHSHKNTAVVATCSVLGALLLVGLIGTLLYSRFKKKEEQQPHRKPRFYLFRTPPSPGSSTREAFYQEMSQPTPGPTGSPGHLPSISPNYHSRSSPDAGSPQIWTQDHYEEMPRPPPGAYESSSYYAMVTSENHHMSRQSPPGNHLTETTQPIHTSFNSLGYPSADHNVPDNAFSQGPVAYFRRMSQDPHPPSPGPSSPGPLLFRSMADPTPGRFTLVPPDGNSRTEMDQQFTDVPLDDDDERSIQAHANPSSSAPQILSVPAPASPSESSDDSEPLAMQEVRPKFRLRKRSMTLPMPSHLGSSEITNQRRPSVPDSFGASHDLPPSLPMINTSSGQLWDAELEEQRTKQAEGHGNGNLNNDCVIHRHTNHPTPIYNSSPIGAFTLESSKIVIESENPPRTLPQDIHSLPRNTQSLSSERQQSPMLTQPALPLSRTITRSSTPITGTAASSYITLNSRNNPPRSPHHTQQIEDSVIISARSTQPPTPRIAINSLIHPPVPDSDTVMTDAPVSEPIPAPDTSTPDILAPAIALPSQLPQSSSPKAVSSPLVTHSPVHLPSPCINVRSSPQVSRWTATNVPPVSIRSPSSQSPRYPRITIHGTTSTTAAERSSQTPHVRRGSTLSTPIMRHDKSPAKSQTERPASSSTSWKPSPARPAQPSSSTNPPPRTPSPASPASQPRYYHSISSNSPPRSPHGPSPSTSYPIILDSTIDPHNLAPLLPAALDLSERLSFDIRSPRLQEEAIMRVREKYIDWSKERAREEVRGLCKRFNRRNAPRKKREKRKTMGETKIMVGNNIAGTGIGR